MEGDDDDKLTNVAEDGYGEVTARATDKLGPGCDVGGYVIDGELGRGGMGVVYSATHPVIGKRAAVKVLRPEVSQSRMTVERFIQEARAVNQIGHPNIIDIFAFGTHTDGRAYHIMDLLVGEPLRARLKRGALHPSEAASVIEEIASALVAAHDKGFVHRDLKPDNVYLVTREGNWPEVKLLDFGLCKLMPEAGQQAPFRTKTGLMLGTPEYMAPEQARGKPVDYRTDIYALGVVMFEILTGRRPFLSGKNPFETLQAHATQPPPSIKLLLPQLPDELVQLVEAMLAKNPDDRPSLAAVRTVIKRLRSTQLPSRTMAGIEMSRQLLVGPASFATVPSVPSMSSLDAIPRNVPSLSGITPSRLGADPMMPSRASVADLHSMNAASTTPMPRAPTGQPLAPSQDPSYGPDPTQLQSRHGSINPVSSDPSRFPPTEPARRPPITHSGLRGAAPSAPTALGIGPIAAPTARSVTMPAQPSKQLPSQPPPHDKLNPVVLLIGAIVAIGIGIAVALALVT